MKANVNWLGHFVFLVIYCLFYGGCCLMGGNKWLKSLHTLCSLPYGHPHVSSTSLPEECSKNRVHLDKQR